MGGRRLINNEVLLKYYSDENNEEDFFSQMSDGGKTIEIELTEEVKISSLGLAVREEGGVF